MTQVERRRDSVPVMLKPLKDEPGTLKLHWPGSLRRCTASRFDIQARFLCLADTDEAVDVRIPMEAFHLLAVGSQWRYGHYRGIGLGRTSWLQLDMANLDV